MNDKLFRKNFLVFVLVFFINITCFCIVRYTVECVMIIKFSLNSLKNILLKIKLFLWRNDLKLMLNLN